MKEVKIEFDYLHGPIWKEKLNVKTGKWSTGISCIDNDSFIQSLNDKAAMIYESLYSFDTECVFDNEEFDRVKGQLLDLVQKIISHLDEINDGSFVVIDKASDMLL